MSCIVIRRPDDLHVHFRRGMLLRSVARFTAKQFARAVIMPNTDPPIRNAEDVFNYREEIFYQGDIEGWTKSCSFNPLMTIKLYPYTTPEVVQAAKKAGIVAGKLYLKGVTTNAEDGVSIAEFPELYPALEEMQNLGVLLLIHGEMPGVFCLDREVEFLPVVEKLAKDFPRLKIVLEHITGLKTVFKVRSLPDTVAATITLHHLELTLDDVIGDKIQPHNFCKPVAKTRKDRIILLSAAMSGNPKFFFGSDSAPHLVGDKECAEGCAGVFTAPVALPRLVEIFEREGKLDKLEDFVSRFGAEFYGLPLKQGTVTLVREPWRVPMVCGGVRPYLAGKILQWKIQE